MRVKKHTLMLIKCISCVAGLAESITTLLKEGIVGLTYKTKVQTESTNLTNAVLKVNLI